VSLDPGRAPLALTNVLLVLSQGRVPVVTVERVREDPAVYRMTIEVTGQGYGVNLHFRGPIKTLDQVMVAAAMALEQAEREDQGAERGR
jgi:hypothetical protein